MNRVCASLRPKALRRGFIAAMITTAPIASLKADDRVDTPKYRFGLQVSYIDPSGDLSDIASSGFGLSLFAERTLTKNNAIRAKIDYMDFGDVTYASSILIQDLLFDFDFESNVSILGISGEWLYRFDSHDKGPFVFVGAGYLDATRKLSSLDDSAMSNSENKAGFSYSAGFGFNFTKNLGLELKITKGPRLKYTETYSNNNDVSYAYAFDWIQASFSYRF